MSKIKTSIKPGMPVVLPPTTAAVHPAWPTLPPDQQTIMAAILADYRRLERDLAGNPLGILETSGLTTDRVLFADGFGVPWSAESKAEQRTTRRLEQLGYLQRIAIPGRQRRTHVRLVGLGLELMELEKVPA